MTDQLLYVGYRLTRTQVDYLRFIVQYAIDHNGNSPGINEAAEQFGVTWSTARGHVIELSNKRLVQLKDGKIVVEESEWDPPDYLD